MVNIHCRLYLVAILGYDSTHLKRFDREGRKNPEEWKAIPSNQSSGYKLPLWLIYYKIGYQWSTLHGICVRIIKSFMLQMAFYSFALQMHNRKQPKNEWQFCAVIQPMECYQHASHLTNWPYNNKYKFIQRSVAEGRICSSVALNLIVMLLNTHHYQHAGCYFSLLGSESQF